MFLSVFFISFIPWGHFSTNNEFCINLIKYTKTGVFNLKTWQTTQLFTLALFTGRFTMTSDPADYDIVIFPVLDNLCQLRVPGILIAILLVRYDRTFSFFFFFFCQFLLIISRVPRHKTHPVSVFLLARDAECYR